MVHQLLQPTVASLFLLAALNTQADVTIADAGRSKFSIVLPANAIPSERYAAEELQRYLEKMSGARLPIITDAESLPSHAILLGDNAHLARSKENVDVSRLGPDGFALRANAKRIVIAGGRPRGTLNGVYTLLEDRLGVRWFTPELEVVPRCARVSLPNLDEDQIPVLENREVFWTMMMHNPDFAARHRLNGQNHNLTEKHGGRFAVYFPFVHSFDLLIPPALYKEHPEYFPMIDGKRVDGYVQRCLANPDVLKLAIANVRQWIKDHPDANIISVSQNDTGKWCQCPDCKALDDREGSPAASMIRFVNAIAENIETDFPNIRIDTLAYQYTRKPPKTLRPRRNVIVRLCSIECCFAHPLSTCESTENRRFREDIIAWEPVAPLLYVWDYTPNFAHYQQPFPNFDALQDNVRFFVSHNVKSLFEQGNYSAGGRGEMEPLRSYLLAKLLWNPNADIRKHTDEFLHAYYGPAAAQVSAYLELLENQVRNGKAHAHIFDSSKVSYLNDQFLNEANRIWEQAERAADSDELRFRVQVARLPIWYVQLVTDRVKGEERTKLLNRFLEIARKAGISNISESQSLEDWAKKMG